MSETTPLLALGISPSSPTTAETINYLAYGSNLGSATLTDFRHIRPLHVTPVRVPSLTLTFTLAGIPYVEPRFANVRPRLPPPAEQEGRELVGVVYEIARADYARLLASEGAGAGYQEFTVACYPLAPTTTSAGNEIITARTLLCPEEDTSAGKPVRAGGQPSDRYLQLLRAGARERGLPPSYVEYLDGLRAYRITRFRQSVGRIFILAVWGPLFFLVLLFNNLFARGGRAPGWVRAFGRGVVSLVWGCYDAVFVKVFGDGECTEGEKPDFFSFADGVGKVAGGVEV
ncbi:hypothetical protein HOY80DRAFT_109729 [Tuber brumale]|nr:hypothetical protein HOY80DRAFT_109729 [Tuber brumale]